MIKNYLVYYTWFMVKVFIRFVSVNVIGWTTLAMWTGQQIILLRFGGIIKGLGFECQTRSVLNRIKY